MENPTTPALEQAPQGLSSPPTPTFASEFSAPTLGATQGQEKELTVKPEKHADLQWLFALAARMRQADNLDTLLSLTLMEVRQRLQADRVLIYRFQTEQQGTVLAEAIAEGYTPSLAASLPAIAFGAEKLVAYQQQPAITLEHTGNGYLSPYQTQLLEQFQVKASVSLPMSLDRGWGLLVVQQCSYPRRWQEAELALLHQVVGELRLHLQPLSFRNERQVLLRVSDKLRHTTDLEAIFQTATRETWKFLGVDRVAICQFQPDYSGRFVAECKPGDAVSFLNRPWEDTYIRESQGGRFRNNQPFVVNQVNHQAGLSACHVEILENFDITACAIVPILQGQQLWGVLCAYQHSGPRHWQADEVNFLAQMGSLLGVALQQAELAEEKRKAIQYKQELPALIDKIGNASYTKNACEAAVQEARRLLNVERVCIYKFRPDYFGDFIYESEAGGFPKLVGSAWEDTYVQAHQGGRFRENQPYVADNIYTAGLSDCHIETLEYFGVKAYLVVPIKQGEKLWGLLTAFQHSGSRHWVESDVTLLADIGRQLGAALQEADYLAQLQEQTTQLAKAAQIDHLVAGIIPKILQAQDLDTILRTTTQAAKRLLKCDRTTIYHFTTDQQSHLLAESLTKGTGSFEEVDGLTFWHRSERPGTADSRSLQDSWVVNNIHTSGQAPEQIEWLEEMGIQAYLVIPIFRESQLWGILAAFEHGAPRSWTTIEVNALKQLCLQVSAAMQQVEYLKQLRQQTEQLAQAAERDRLITKIVERVQQTQDLQTAFKNTAREIRNFLNVDRVAVFKFYPGSGFNEGETIAEDVRPGYAQALGVKVGDHCFGERHAELYRQGRTWAIADIYQANLAPCYIEILAQFQVRANLVVPLLKGDELWGLFCIHHCSEAREWQAVELEFAKQIAAQLNVAIQQGEFIEQLQKQSQQLAEAAQQDKAAKEQLQQEVIQVLAAVRPALDGDLTVRAPVTDNIVGTIADVYNNTLGSLRQIVMQMQTTAEQVAQTSADSDTSINQLTAQAQQQFQALTQALDQVQRMVNSTQAVEMSAQQVEVAVQQANQVVQAGDAAMDRTVDSISDLRETVTETNKRLKRLSDSSKKISKVVNLISHFTTQTQLLALNASIEATRAGEYGRGFAVVADEVRSLARQSADAATEIEQLVQEIQASTAEVSTAMETGIQQVTEGTDLVTDARQNLNAIVEATQEISQLVRGITHTTGEQTQQFQSVSQTMTEVAAISNKTSEESVAISTSFKELLTLAKSLQTRSNQFKVN